MIMESPIMQVENVLIQYGGVIAVQDVSFSIQKGERVGLIGPNGAGKTSLINVLSGFHLGYQGNITLYGNDITKLQPHQRVTSGLTRSFQTAKIYKSRTVQENLDSVIKFSNSDIEIDLRSMNPELYQRRTEVSGQLPYGLQKQLGCILAYKAAKHILLLDEPAAGLATDERKFVDLLIDMAVERDCAVLLIEHDMEMIRRNCNRTIVLANGKLLVDGETEEILKKKEVIESYLGEEVG
jgi:branched-chain amino acid transport system ATP-binding protein